MQLRADAALIDIEGTVGSIAFVHDVLFPYARQRMDAFIESHCDDNAVRSVLDAAAREAGIEAHDLPAILSALHEWSDRDVKVTPLKELQGMIWKSGFESGEIRAGLYPDAVEALHRFARSGVRLFVYSSGSIAAQQLLFGHTVDGDLRPLFEGYFDTTTGPKRDASSYEHIANAIGVAPQRLVFFSDHPAELDAARTAGVQTVQLARPQDGTVATNAHPSVPTFTGIEVEARNQ
ncbi:MAG TPA: acireductone synthase [Candidatus Cybelea sp.]|nr:acireductone synthase [Candidatus Cybelea sp.]